MGKVLSIVILIAAVIAGGALYYLQVYHFYDEARLASEGGEVEMRITLAGGQVIDLPVSDFRAIDAESSPIRFRACFTAHLPQDVGLVPYPAAEPLNAPSWFDCFDAKALGAALAEGRARAYLGEENIRYGIDRIIAISEDGRGHAWHQINRCGEKVFDGQPAPEGCPQPPQGN
ncbi:MAG: histidine kinase [Roseovarius sp.]|nr:histidine kinase [Roseovarius sp.]